ncbi:MAG: hypothetical protein RR712_03360 [Terrisporobacter sp.]
MSWYNGTFSCGCEGRVNVTGPTKNRQWIVDRKFEGLCPDCYDKKLEADRIKANEVALKKSKEMELPELIGTEKQVAWATTLRQKLIDKVEIKLDAMDDRKGNRDLVNKVFNYILTDKVTAKWFIDNRYEYDTLNSLEMFFRRIKKEIKTDEEIIEEKNQIDVKIESTVAPEDIKYTGIVEILPTETKIEVIYEKNDKFRDIVKNLKYKWEGTWEREIHEVTGSYKDRAAELGNKLLNAGFSICIYDEEIRERAVVGDYEAECNRWIYRHKDKNDILKLKWYEKNDKLYHNSRKLPGSKWEDGTTQVNVSKFVEVEEFAEMYGFKFTKLATERLENYKNNLPNIERVKPVRIAENVEKDGFNDILNSSREVLDDLKED